MPGPAPKPANQRARRNKDITPAKIVDITGWRAAQPELPDFSMTVEVDGALTSQEFVWPERTREWWQMWASSPLSKDFTIADWDYLLDTALIHARYWQGDLKLAGELRLRVAKFGQTPEDRLRLRIQFATADEGEERARERRAKNTPELSSRSRNRRVKRLDGGEAHGVGAA